MEVIYWPGEKPPSGGDSVVTLGVFDGVHQGHAAVIRRVADAAQQRQCPSAVVTFDRHPAAVIHDRREPAITSLDHRIRLFRGFALDLCVVIRFTRQVADMPAGEFARVIFKDLLHARLLVLGFDCRFGRNREGDVALCKELAGELGLEVVSVPPVKVDGGLVSSTAIRKAILAGDFARAQRLLGRPFSLYGTVVPGDGRGKRIGWPSANLDLHNETVPPDGVYACWVYIDGQPLPGLASIGTRATFHREAEPERVVEAHLIDRDEDLYGRDLEVQFAGFVREQKVFDSAEDLMAQIARDVEQAKALLRLAQPETDGAAGGM